jgi:hypothetical protein
VYKKAIESSGHKYETVQKVAETCQTMGCEQDYIRCTTCKDTFGYIEIPVNSEKHNIEIIEYLNNRDDISYDEMVAILLDLGFKVSADGMVRW